MGKPPGSSSGHGAAPPAASGTRNDLGRLLSPVTPVPSGRAELKLIDAIRNANANPAPESTSSVITRITINEEPHFELIASVLGAAQGICGGIVFVIGGVALQTTRCIRIAGGALLSPFRFVGSRAFPSRQRRAARKVRKAFALLCRGPTKKAMDLFNAAILLDSSTLQGFAGRAMLNAALDRDADAERDFRAAIELFERGTQNPAKNETYKACYNGLVFALVRQRRFWEAMRTAARTDKINGTTQTELLKSFVPEIFARFSG